MSARAYPIIHLDPYSILLTPSVAGPVGTVKSTSAVNWMTAYLQAGGSKYADGGAYHGYLAENGKPLFQTEGSWGNGYLAGESDSQVA